MIYRAVLCLIAALAVFLSYQLGRLEAGRECTRASILPETFTQGK
jgi:hypothetical protein